MPSKKAKVNFKIYDFTNLETNITIHILPNILWSKNNEDHAIKFGQLIEYNIRNVFLEKSDAKFGGETCLRPI